LSTASYNQCVIHATYLNNKKKPLDDPRVRRAMHLALHWVQHEASAEVSDQLVKFLRTVNPA
jgi:ABC-type transport system substrate-binding protein